MHKIILVLTLLVLSSSCTNDDDNIKNSCGVDNVLEDLAWLKEIKFAFEASTSAIKKTIIQYTYNNETVFLINDCVNCADVLTKVYNCKKELICEFGGIAGLNTCPDFEDNATNKIILYEN